MGARGRSCRALGAVLLAWLASGCAVGSPRDPETGAVPWEAWGPAPFARAAAQRKPVLVHVIAGWCHWCHVMDHETYGDPAVADLIARELVAIRVDSDARPDLGERYRRWGWPAVALLDPDGQPILVRRGYQEAGPFLALLRRVLEDLRAGRPYRDAQELPPAAGAGDPPPGELGQALALTRAQLDGFYDLRLGGWGRGLQRYPLSEPLEHALLRARRPGEGQWRERALRTLAAQEALLDPAWGGLYQYSDDGTWASPHFEKIVPVQAGGLEVYTLAWLETGDPRWLADARAIARYVREHLQDRQGSFAASQDADPPPGSGLSGREYFALDAAARARLGEPRVDRAVYADLNAQLARGLALLGGASDDPGLVSAAATALERLARTHAAAAAEGGGFTHLPAAQEGPAPILHLGDQVAVGRAALALHAATGQERWLELAARVARALTLFEDPAGGGFFAATPDPVQVGTFAARRKPWQENAAAARLLLELAALEEDEPARAALRARAEAALRAQAQPALIASWGRMCGGYLLALEAWAAPPLVIELVLPADQADGPAALALRAGPPALAFRAGPPARALHRAALRAQRPGRLLRVRAPHPGEPARAPFLRACGANTCSPLIEDPLALEGALRDVEAPSD